MSLTEWRHLSTCVRQSRLVNSEGLWGSCVVLMTNFLHIIHHLSLIKDTRRLGDWIQSPPLGKKYTYSVGPIDRCPETGTGSVDWAQQSRCPFYLMVEIESSLQNVVCLHQRQTMDNVQKDCHFKAVLIAHTRCVHSNVKIFRLEEQIKIWGRMGAVHDFWSLFTKRIGRGGRFKIRLVYRTSWLKSSVA
jgi:hypothetical protein